MTTPLAGIRVVEYHAGIAAATAGLLLRDAGAEVIKVEPPGGDASRVEPGHRAWNRGKRSVVLDDGDPRLAGLLASADVVLLGGGLQTIPGWSPGADQIVCSSPPYADAEPFRSLPENDGLASALAGVLAGTGSYRPGPAFSTIPTLSYSAGALMASAVAAALCVRQATGRGQHVSVPWPTLGAYFAGYQASESDRMPYMASQGGASPIGLSVGWRAYETSDGWMGVACANPVFFQRLCVALDRVDVISDPRFQTAPFVFNPADRDALTNIIAETFRTKTREEWTEIFEANGVPAASLMTREDFVTSDLVRENGMIVQVDDPEVGPVDQVAVPYELSGCEFAPPAAAPRLGADTGDVSALSATSRTPAPGQGRLPSHPLAGVRVLDLTGFLAGPTAGRLLAELGAEVIKVEPPGGEGFRGAGLSCAGVNMGKKSVAIDMSQEAGRKLRDQLIESADVIMHALIPGAPEKLGLDYESVRAINPRIIHCWISGFGKAKKWRARPSFDLLLQALSGQMFALGSKEQPIYSSIPMADLYGGMLSVYGIVLSLYLRQKTGEGRAFTTNQVASSMAAQNGQFVRYAGMPQVTTNGNSIGARAWYRYYQVSDGWVMLAVDSPESWARLGAAIGQRVEAWRDWVSAKDEPAEGPLAAVLAATFAGLTRKEIVEQFTEKGVPVAPVVVVREDRITNEYFRSLGVLVEGIQHDLFGTITTVGDFFSFSATPSRPPDMTQWVGEHNREVLSGLGYSESEIDRLAEAGVIASPEFRLVRL
jgi:crotonobetainyl-CoA:carnitine CoA-transferase CaiB-like acyl-CoA transferase